MSNSRPASRSRAGLTLVELLVALVLGTIVLVATL
ncbi:prepilin-type N-terminal cleavage/methylation domain-containing protein [Deinococcus pimensis]|nr:prepilin-type N-terminal cleavage/methylation domain-containing protein [Deinococcus pimensis]